MGNSTSLHRVYWFAITFGCSFALFVGPSNGVAQEPGSPPADEMEATPQSPGPGSEIEAVLDRMERAGVTIQDLKCQVTYTVKDEINDDTRTRKGEIRFVDQKPNPIFYVHFDKLVQDGAVHRDDEWYVFDGATLWEAKSKTRNVVKRELVEKGQYLDLFDIEQSPIPIPFGQRKAEILNSFDVKMLPSSPQDPRDTIHLACTPKESSRLAKDYDRMDFYVCRTVDLPIRIVTIRKGGEQVEVADFPDLTTGSMNNGMTVEEVKLPPDVAGYQVIEEKLGQGKQDGR